MSGKILAFVIARIAENIAVSRHGWKWLGEFAARESTSLYYTGFEHALSMHFFFFLFYFLLFFFFMVDSLKAVSGACCPGLYCPSYESSSQNNIFYFPFYSFPISTIISRSQTILSYRLKTKAIAFSLGYPIIVRRRRAVDVFIVRMYSYKRISNGLPVVDKVLSEYIRQAYSV